MNLILPLMYLPRRHRRRLLLPPGWVALGFLLLLGCLLVQRQWRRLRLVNVVQLTMPPLNHKSLFAAHFNEFGEITEYNPYVHDITSREAPIKLAALRPWHTIEFGGQPFIDFFTANIIEANVVAIQRDSVHAGGVRIHFRTGTTYASLVQILDMMNRTKQVKYWLDIYHQPTTFYAITQKYQPDKILTMDCGTVYARRDEFFPTPVLKANEVVAYLQQPIWWLTLLILTVISSSNVCRLFWQRKFE